MSEDFEIAITVPPGLEPVLQRELVSLEFPPAKREPGAVSFKGTWTDVWRANLWVRGGSRVLVRLGQFRAMHLAQLDKRARKVEWGEWLVKGAAVRVEAGCRQSKIYHSGAAAERVARAATDAVDGSLDKENGHLLVVRIQKDLCTISLDTSGALLYRRGFKQAVAKAPLRESLAALFLRSCGYTGAEPVLDPMCGSGTIPIEAAEIALGLAPGRARQFAFEGLRSFKAQEWQAMKDAAEKKEIALRFYGWDRNETAVTNARENAARAGVDQVTEFIQCPVSRLDRPDGPPGLVLVNPPYGTRIGDKSELRALHASMGRVFKERFAGWRAGLITSEPSLAKATRLPWSDVSPPIPHGPLKVKLYQTGVL